MGLSSVFIGNYAQETTETTGTVTFNLDGPASGTFQSFVSALGEASKDLTGPWPNVLYHITDGTDHEIGLGVLTDGSPDTLTRVIILESTNAGDKVDWSAGVKTIIHAAAGQFISGLIEEQTISSDSTIDFINGINSLYDIYEIDLMDVVPTSDNKDLYLLLSTDLGVSWLSSYNFSVFGSVIGAAIIFAGGAAAAQISLTPSGIGSSAGEGLSGKVKIYNPSDTVLHTYGLFDVVYKNLDSSIVRASGGFATNITTAIDGIQFKPESAGTLESGVIRLLGKRN